MSLKNWYLNDHISTTDSLLEIYLDVRNPYIVRIIEFQAYAMRILIFKQFACLANRPIYA